MAQDRVDKRWQDLGLAKFSTEAILGTLGHYGVALDEAKFRALAKEKYPLEMALEWADRWKGTGQFKLFPSAAAAELWKRLETDRLAPVELAQALMDVMVAMSQRIDGAKDAPVAQKLEAFEALKAKVPQKDGGSEERFTGEAFAHFTEEVWKVFDGMAERLASEGLAEDARAFAGIEEFLVPERKGISVALVDAAEGKRDQALAAIKAVAGDGSSGLERRMAALEALLALDAKEEAIELGMPLLDEAEKREDFHVAMGLADRLVTLFRERRDFTRAQELTARLERIVEGHQRAHPHHHH